VPHTSLPPDYAERVYAGVLGKLIGVYLGRPFEGWTYERIMAELGEITYYVHDKRSVPLIVTDDDITGTFTFLRALSDYGYSRNITPAQIGQTWLNYIIEGRTILWWGDSATRPSIQPICASPRGSRLLRVVLSR
jgi:ADP-ribosylglycohydrolase